MTPNLTLVPTTNPALQGKVWGLMPIWRHETFDMTRCMFEFKSVNALALQFVDRGSYRGGWLWHLVPGARLAPLLASRHLRRKVYQRQRKPVVMPGLALALTHKSSGHYLTTAMLGARSGPLGDMLVVAHFWNGASIVPPYKMNAWPVRKEPLGINMYASSHNSTQHELLITDHPMLQSTHANWLDNHLQCVGSECKPILAAEKAWSHTIRHGLGLPTVC